ncbi:sodium-independent anion transporter [Pseudohongiella nitratireducens]|uniref:Sodium-independent anion transporter n=1 Tax=Pseudohongiella nitratireducens TaxID=1768907 RepID=A0A917LU86_9GAMM|nr:sulfate permease [Pseudohongiella nitratireducens]MDF1623660.1 sulfate permease [Pseudohongiella nitratireducens]GGG58146.1 sodium-independent anion transporter [Pseudohongiella nitratireducens]|tara:strand:+ start:128 stop:1849 length:1722 start_codon:yes stop_codon:yes gene_type:complete
MKRSLAQFMPILDWGRTYNRQTVSSDLLAAVIVTIMLIPQSLAYALLAGLPAQVGLYASMLPLIAYGIFGSSRTLSVGPVAVVSLMTATAIGQIAQTGTIGYLQAAMLLAFMSGAFLLLMGLLRMGFLANFLSHPVIAGFITASGILIACSQLKHILGIEAHGENLPVLISSLISNLSDANLATVAIGVPVVLFLFWVRSGLARVLRAVGLSAYVANLIAKTGPVTGVLVSSFVAYRFQLGEQGVALVGQVPVGLPVLSVPDLTHPAWRQLLVSAIFISVIGFVESVSVGHTLAAKRRQRISPDQELIGLGAANIASSFSGGYPVTGGFARSVVNFDAGAQTPAAGMMAAVGIALAALYLTPLLAWLPNATLAATIIVAVLSLIDLSILKRTWVYAKSDFVAVTTTIVVTLTMGVETGVACGVLASLALHLFKTSQPHIAVVGEVPGTEHYRNVNRHQVVTYPSILSIRIDESLYFANATYIEDQIYELLEKKPTVKHVILMCTAVNEIDLSALEVLESVNHRLMDSGIDLHLSEIKGPVMDVLERTRFIEDLSGRVWLSQHQAEQYIIKHTQ